LDSPETTQLVLECISTVSTQHCDDMMVVGTTPSVYL